MISTCRGSASSSHRPPPSAPEVHSLDSLFKWIASCTSPISTLGPITAVVLTNKCFPNSPRNALHSDLRPLKEKFVTPAHLLDHPDKTCCVHLREALIAACQKGKEKGKEERKRRTTHNRTKKKSNNKKLFFNCNYNHNCNYFSFNCNYDLFFLQEKI